MMDAVRQWAFSLCAAAMACAVIELLLPSISLAKMTRLALSVFFLCVLIQPLGLEAHRSEISLKTGQGMEQAEEYAAEISGRIGEDLSGSVRSAVEEELALIGLSPAEYELEIGLGSEETPCDRPASKGQHRGPGRNLGLSGTGPHDPNQCDKGGSRMSQTDPGTLMERLRDGFRRLTENRMNLILICAVTGIILIAASYIWDEQAEPAESVSDAGTLLSADTRTLEQRLE